MPSSRHLVFIRTLGVTACIVLVGHASASPLPREAALYEEGRAAQRFSDTDLALRDTRRELLPDGLAASTQGQLLGTERSLSGSRNFDFGQLAQPAGGSMQEMLRGFITVRRGAAPAASPGGPARGNRRTADDGLDLDLGLTDNEWIRGQVQSVMTSVLHLSVNERGEASFSLLGLGDFSVVVSGDRSEIAFVSGDEIITSARRASHAAPGAGAAYAGGAGGFDAGPGAASVGATESPLRRALQLMLEIATHPLSFLVYALAGGYALIWGILSQRARRPLHTTARSHRARPTALAPIGPAAVPVPAPKKRKRTRVRLRVRKYR